MKRIALIFLICTLISIPASAAEIRVLYNSDYYPFEFTNDRGQADGFVIDIIYALAREAGFEVTFTNGNWKELESNLLEDKAHFSPAYRMIDHGQSIIISKTLFSVPFSLIYNKALKVHSFKDLNGKIPLFSSGDSSEMTLYSVLEPENVIRTKTWSDTLKALNSGYGDYTMISSIQKNMLMNEYSSTLSVLEEFSLDIPYVLYSTRWDKNQMEKMNNGISIIRASGEYDRILMKWFDDPAILKTDDNSIKITLYFLVPILFGTIIIMRQIKKRKEKDEYSYSRRC